MRARAEVWAVQHTFCFVAFLLRKEKKKKDRNFLLRKERG